MTVNAPAHHRGSLAFFWTFAAAAVLYVCTNSPSALYPVYEQIYGITPFTITTIYAVYSATLIPTLITVGSLGHVIGMRKLLAAAWLLGAVGVGLFALADAPWMLYVARLVQGMAMGVATGGMAASLVALERNRDTRRASVALTLAISIGGGIGPIIGGIFVAYFADPQRLFFEVLAVAMLILAAGFLAFRKDLGITGVAWEPRLPKIPTGEKAPFLLACGSSSLVWATVALFLTLVPSYFHDATGNTNPILAAASAGLTLTSAGVAQLLTSRVEPWLAQRVGVVLACAGLGLLVLGGSLNLGWLILASAVVAGFGMGTAFLGGTNAVNAFAASRPDHASVFAAYFMSTYFGSSLPIVGIGLVGNLIGTATAVATFGVLLLALVVVWFVAERRSMRTAEPAR